MKSTTLSRLIGAASAGALFLAGVPAVSAQTAAELNASGIVKRDGGNLAGAVDDFTAAIALKPDYIQLYANRAVAETGQGAYDGAIIDYTEVIKAKPNQANGYLLRGLVNFLKGDLDKAGRDYIKAIELDPKDPTLYLYRGLFFDLNNDQGNAVLDYTKTLDLSAGGDSETANYAQLYRGLDLRRRGPGTDQGLTGWTKWKSAWTRNLAAFLSNKLSEADLLGRAGADVQDYKSKNREKAEAYYFVGRVHLIAGDTVGARRNFAASVELQFPADVGRKLAQAELDRMPAM